MQRQTFREDSLARFLPRALKLGFVLFCLGAAALFYARTTPEPLVTEIKNDPFRYSYVVNTHNLGDPEYVEIYIILQQGEADMEGPEGLLHYVEHLSITNAMKKSGSKINPDSNAWTNSRSVGYWISSPKAKFPENLKKLMGVFNSIDLSEDLALKERNVILREYDVWLANRPETPIEETLDRYLYSGNGLSRSVGGKPAEINRFSLSAAKQLHASTHKLGNAALVVVGEISTKEVEATLARLENVAEKTTQQSSFVLGEQRTEIVRFPNEPGLPKLIWKRAIELEKAVPYEVLNLQCKLLEDILRADLPGSLAKPLHFDSFVAQSFEVSVRVVNERHIELKFSAQPSAGKRLADLLSEYEKVLSEIASTGIPADTFERVSKRSFKDLPDENDSRRLSEWAKYYVLDRVSDQRRPLALDEIRKIVGNIEPAHVNSLLSLVEARGRTIIALIGKDT